MTTPFKTIAQQKALIREAALTRRDAMPATDRDNAAHLVVSRLLKLPELGAAGCIAGFWPIRSEIDIRGVLEQSHDNGRTVALPVVSDKGLAFRRWSPGDRLVKRRFGLSEPDSASPEVRPSVLLVPLAAFDRSGARIGYGKGYYDRAIDSFPADSVMTIGVAFAIQESLSIPQEPHDRRLSIIVTEAEIIRVQG